MKERICLGPVVLAVLLMVGCSDDGVSDTGIIDPIDAGLQTDGLQDGQQRDSEPPDLRFDLESADLPEGWCSNGAERPCDTGSPGVCGTGRQVCVNNVWWEGCSLVTVPGSQPEDCEGTVDFDCDGLLPTKDPDCDLCKNGAQDPTETDVDCGGSCAPCTTGKACLEHDDCGSGYCENKLCTAPTFEWKADDWGQCSVDCGGGKQTRDVNCEREDGMPAPEAQCTNARPVGERACNTERCYGYTWQQGSWGKCSEACGPGDQTRSVWCERDDKEKADDSACDAAQRPVSTVGCNDGRCVGERCPTHAACASKLCQLPLIEGRPCGSGHEFIGMMRKGNDLVLGCRRRDNGRYYEETISYTGRLSGEACATPGTPITHIASFDANTVQFHCGHGVISTLVFEDATPGTVGPCTDPHSIYINVPSNTISIHCRQGGAGFNISGDTRCREPRTP